MTLYHGGIAGKRPGDLLVPSPPHVSDGCPICVARADLSYARWYAARSKGDLYVVEAIGSIRRTQEDHFPSWTCAAARVVSVVERSVRLTRRERRSLTKAWKAADREVMRALCES